MHGGKTFVLEELSSALLMVYPKNGEQVKVIFERLKDHLTHVKPDKKSYTSTLHQVIRYFHDDPPAPIHVPPPAAVPEATIVIDTFKH